MPNTKVKLDPLLRTSLLSHNQLIDSLTSHIALYNSSSSSKSSSSNPNPRSSILKWFQSLSVPQRQSHLTIISHSFVQMLIQMLTHLHQSGHGFFIILPDLPSDSDRTLPSLCYRKSDGLLSRISESNSAERSIFDSVRIFSSKEGENVGECSVSMTCLDCVSVSEEFVENVDSFVGIMDCVSNGGFLRGEESGLGKDWVESGWLKDKGYYSIEAFVANRLEVTLRSAWLCCVGNSGRKRGVKLKEKVTLSGVAENVFWRKKGCVDWWRGLDVETRRKVLAAALGKSAKALSQEILVEANGVSKDKQWAFGIGGGELVTFNHNSSSLQRRWRGFLPDAEFGSSLVQDSLSKKPALTRASNHLFVLQEIVTIIWSCLHSACDRENMFYSSLSSVGTLADCILRKLRGFLMFVSLESTKLELLGEGNPKLSPYRSKEKLGACTRKKKGKPHNNAKSTSSITSSVRDLTSVDQLHEDVNCTSKHSEKSMSEFSKTPKNPQKSGSCEDTSSIKVEMEPVQHSVTGKGETASRKSKREKRKNKKSIFKTPAKDKSLKKASAEAPSSSVILHDDIASSVSCLKPYESSSTCDSRNGNVPRKHILASKNGHSGKDGYSKIIDESFPAKLIMDSSDSSFSCSQISNTVVEDSCLPSGLDILEQTCKAIISNCSLSESHSTSMSEGDDMSKSVNMNSNTEKLTPCKQSSDKNEKELSVPRKDTGDSNGSAHVSTLDCQSYEWPNVAASHFPSNLHLPPATDRLHLDVGLNWQNHFCQPFLPAVRQTRNHPIENGCKQILARPMPMSLDWPPMVRSACGLASSFTCNYDAGFISRYQSAFHQGFSPHMGQHSLGNSDEKKFCGDFTDMPDSANALERADEYDSQWFSEEELEVHGVSGLDYNQYFGGGVMYWNPSDHPGTGYSRPPSLSSDDSFWAWQEADINRAVDDMVALSSSYSTTGLASPTAASFCSPFDPLSSGHQALGYVVQGNEVPGQGLNSSSPAITEKVGEDEVSGPLASLPVEVEVKTGDSLPYPVLRPIIIPNISRERSSPRPLTRREQPRIKRPPSPVVLCVPRAPRPPPPSPVGDPRKHRGFPTVRSGSSSPRHWGMRGWNHDGGNLEEGCLRVDGAEVVLPSWRNNNLSSHPMIQPLPGSLLQDRLIAISHLTRDQEHPDVAFPLQPPELQNSSARKVSLMLMHSCLHDEIDAFCKQVAAENLSRKPFVNWAVKRVTRSLQVLWPRSRTNIFGSNATGLSLPSSDVDLVVCLPPVRNLEPIKEAGILEGRNGIKETCLQHAARYLANQEWVKNDSLKTVENTAIPIIMLVVEVPHDLVTSGTSNVPSPKEGQCFVTGEHCSQSHASESVPEDAASPKSSQANSDANNDSKYVRLDISFKSISHTGLQTTELVKELTEQFPAVTPLALVLKQFLADRSLDQSYSGGLSSYCLVILITRFLQHEHHLGRSINQNFGSLLMDFLYFFGNVFDPRQMRISVQGSGLYMKRERGYSIDPLHIDDPLFPANNVGRNCFRIHQCIKVGICPEEADLEAFSEAYSILEEELTCLPDDKDNRSILPYKLLLKIIPSIETL